MARVVNQYIEANRAKKAAEKVTEANTANNFQTGSDNSFVKSLIPGKFVGEGIANNAKVPTQAPYASKVNDAIASTSGNGQIQPQSNNEPKIDTIKLERDSYNKGVEEATNKYTSSNQGNMDTFTANETLRREAEAEAIRAKVRAAIAQGTQAQNKIINDAPAQYVDPMNRASFQGRKNADMLKESLARRGRYYSGDMDMAEMINNNETAGNINDLENSKAKVISDAQAAIANLQASGSLQEVTLVQEAAAKSLERLQAQQNIIENRANEQAKSIYDNSLNALKTNYDIGANERQLGMQEKTTDSSLRMADAGLTGIDSKTGLPTADMQRFTKTFNADEAKTLFNQAFQNKSFDYQKTRDTISDKQYDAKWAQELDNIAYSRSENNPAVKSQIINNAIADIEKSRMLDNNSPENQNRYNQAAIFKKQLADLMAISPEMKVKEFNAGLDQIYQSIASSKANVDQGWAQIAISKDKSASSGSSNKFDSNRSASIDDYSKFMDSNFTKKELDEDNKPTGRVSSDKWAEYDYIASLFNDGTDPQIVDELARIRGINPRDFTENKRNIASASKSVSNSIPKIN